MMRWQYPATGSILLAAWAAFAGWQYHEYGHQCQAARQALSGEADSLTSALVGGVQSHRRLGRFFEDQIQGVLDGVAATDNVLAVGVRSADGRALLSAGDRGLLEGVAGRGPGHYWDDEAFCRIERFEVRPAAAGPPAGRGRGRRWQQETDLEEEGPLAQGGTFSIALLLDRGRADAEIEAARRLRLFVTLAGGIALGCLAAAWWATVRLAAAKGRARLLETEARHLRELGQAAAGLAHETRNPLGLIRGWSQQLATSGAADSQGQRRAEAVVEECDRVTSRINEFLSFARPRAPSPAEVPAAELVEELAVLLQPDLEARSLRLVVRPIRVLESTATAGLPGSAPSNVWADREMLRQALFNLIQNAIQFAPEGSAVEIGVNVAHDGSGRFEVCDRGGGVLPERVDSLFAPYFTTRDGGTGLGLAIVRRIVSAHGGQCGYRPRPGGGSLFWIELPSGSAAPRQKTPGQ